MAPRTACSPSRYRHVLMTAHRARVGQAVFGPAIPLCTIAGAHLALLTYLRKDHTIPPDPTGWWVRRGSCYASPSTQ